MNISREDNMDYPVEEFVGNNADYVIFVQSHKDQCELIAHNGKFRWLWTKEDGTKVILRPEQPK